MAPNAEGERKTGEVCEPIKSELPVCRVPMRRFRDTLTQITKSGQPVIVTRDGKDVGVFVPQDCYHARGAALPLDLGITLLAVFNRVASVLFGIDGSKVPNRG